jgi:hypothetical protein
MHCVWRWSQPCQLPLYFLICSRDTSCACVMSENERCLNVFNRCSHRHSCFWSLSPCYSEEYELRVTHTWTYGQWACGYNDMDMVSVSVARFFLRRSTGFLAFIFLFYYSGGTPLVNSPMICGSLSLDKIYLILSLYLSILSLPRSLSRAHHGVFGARGAFFGRHDARP